MKGGSDGYQKAECWQSSGFSSVALWAEGKPTAGMRIVTIDM
jgi:hypothetical protein